MRVELNSYDLHILLSWWEESRSGLFGSLGASVATLREITLADRLQELRAPRNGHMIAPHRQSIREAEEAAGQILDEELARITSSLAELGHEVVYAGIVHAVPVDDPRYWSVVDLQVEAVGVASPQYHYFSTDLPVWRDGTSCLNGGGTEFRAAVRQTLEGWLAEIRSQA